jgi:hypothetical protein
MSLSWQRISGLPRYLENTDIEVINEWAGNVEIKHAIFDHDGTISTLREGWELIMAPDDDKSHPGRSATSSADKAVL